MKSRIMKLGGGDAAQIRAMRNAYKILVGKPEGKRSFRRLRRRREDNIRMNFREIWWENLEWIHVAQVGTSICPWEQYNKPSGSIKCWKCLD
jgi:hypothetical protein